MSLNSVQRVSVAELLRRMTSGGELLRSNSDSEAEGDFERAIPIILKLEGGDQPDGGYVNNPHDPGGETKFGIAKKYNPNVDIQNLTRAQATEIYRTKYWTPTQCDSLPWPLSLVHFDCAVNQGPGRAALILQRSVGVRADGVIGSQTLSAAATAKEPETALRYLFLRLRAYVQSYDEDRNKREFLRDWVVRMFQLSSVVA
jgi:lysozyme family protein